MEQAIIKTIKENLDRNLSEIIISNSSNKDKISKIKIHPILLKEQLVFQSETFKGKQVFHNNDTKEELLVKCIDWLEGTTKNETKVTFKQVQIQTKSKHINILISKKGKATIKTKMTSMEEDYKVSGNNLAHNRKKDYILEEGIKVPFLIDLGIMSTEGKIIRTKYDKFKQINRFLEFVEDILPSLDKEKEITIIDFGCGKSYLTFAMYYYLKELKGYPILMIGLDLKEEVIEHCNELSKRYGYHKLQFLTGDIATYEGVDSVDMVVSLHACDTATDYALYKAISWGAKVILSVPCCQHELNHQINCEQLENVLKYGLIKEKVAALLTDGIRANLLETMGYKTQILEFIDMEHTPKNILIRGIKSSKANKSIEQHKLETMNFFGVNPTLYQLLKKDMEEKSCKSTYIE